ncbi:aldo/keto reductase [Caulobacter segnis]
MSDMYGPSDRAESLATFDAAVEAGITLIDTGDFYGMGHNEMLIGEALRRPASATSWCSASRPAPCAIRTASSWVSTVARPRSRTSWPIAEAPGRRSHRHLSPLAPRSRRADRGAPSAPSPRLVQAGYVRHIGLSEMGSETIRRAAKVAPIVDLQIEYSLVSRGVEEDILPTLRELGIGVTAYGVLSRRPDQRPLGPRIQAKAAATSAPTAPRFQGENLDANLKLAEALRAVAESKGVTTAQAAIAWVASRGDDIVPLIGAPPTGIASRKRWARWEGGEPHAGGPGGHRGPRCRKRPWRVRAMPSR